MSIFSSTPQCHGEYTNSSWLKNDLKVRKCHAMLFFENLYEPKVDLILTISFKMTAETCFASYFADELYRLCMGYVFHCHEMRFHCF